MLMWTAIAFLACFSVAVSGYALQNRKHLLELQAQFASVTESLRSELSAVNSGAIGVGQRLIAAEKRLNELVSDQQQWQSDAEAQPFRHAVNLVERGAEPKQLAEQFGLTESEAQLMALMKNRKASMQ